MVFETSNIYLDVYYIFDSDSFKIYEHEIKSLNTIMT